MLDACQRVTEDFRQILVQSNWKVLRRCTTGYVRISKFSGILRQFNVSRMKCSNIFHTIVATFPKRGITHDFLSFS